MALSLVPPPLLLRPVVGCCSTLTRPEDKAKAKGRLTVLFSALALFQSQRLRLARTGATTAPQPTPLPHRGTTLAW